MCRNFRNWISIRKQIVNETLEVLPSYGNCDVDILTKKILLLTLDLFPKNTTSKFYFLVLDIPVIWNCNEFLKNYRLVEEVLFISRGYKRFFRRAGLETSDYLKNDSLSISCTVGVVVSSTQGPRLYSIPVPESNIGEQFGAILDEGENTDIIFNVGRESFHAHKLVLATRSPVFKAQLFGPLADHNKDLIDVSDIEPPVFKVLSSFSFFVEVLLVVFQNMEAIICVT